MLAVLLPKSLQVWILKIEGFTHLFGEAFHNFITYSGIRDRDFSFMFLGSMVKPVSWTDRRKINRGINIWFAIKFLDGM